MCRMVLCYTKWLKSRTHQGNINSSVNIVLFARRFPDEAPFFVVLTKVPHELEAFTLALESTPCVLIYR